MNKVIVVIVSLSHLIIEFVGWSMADSPLTSFPLIWNIFSFPLFNLAELFHFSNVFWLLMVLNSVVWGFIIGWLVKTISLKFNTIILLFGWLAILLIHNKISILL
ncbi:MAG: hypothetical protein A2298_04920 [Gammaproteobacteria bacterium RIFOXYB2_FULL_38_6]|nr:MAG: hypothetical protein A2298_04920 [Gammaproteobacteria bacterium RIFOXYB2_FULL_38_6]